MNKLQLSFRILEVDSNGKVFGEGTTVQTNAIDINIGAVGRRMLVDYSNVLYGNVVEDDFGVYFWEHGTFTFCNFLEEKICTLENASILSKCMGTST